MITPWWTEDLAALFERLGSSPGRGLGEAEARRRLAATGANRIAASAAATPLRLAARQFSSPLVLILAAGALVSLALGEWVDAATILLIIAGSAGLGFWQELGALHAVERLRGRLALRARVLRDGELAERPAADLVPGDVVELAAGHMVPADGRVVDARDLLVSQAALTGESFPVDKQPGTSAPGTPLAGRGSALYQGSSVQSGQGRLLVVATGADTELAGVAARVGVVDEESAFEHGVRRFGGLLLRVMLGVVVAVLLVNQGLGRPLVESALFAVALAVGLSPELLPAIVSVSLARAARRLADAGVLVRRLDAIEDLGGMDTLCTDKTGTLTMGTVALVGALDPAGAPSSAVLHAAWLNAFLETGMANPIDQAIVAAGAAAGLDAAGWHKVDEMPYDFARRRLTLVLEPRADAGASGPARTGAGGAAGSGVRIVSKGAVTEVLAVCSHVAAGGGALPLDAAARGRLQAWARARGEEGLRVLAVALAERPAQVQWGVTDERDLVFAGFLTFADPPRPDARSVLTSLGERRVRVRIVTGDNRHVTAHLAHAIGLDARALLTGEQIGAMRDEALWHLAERTDCFCEVTPSQKERIVRALQHRGHSVGYLGDGINDAPALHAADVGISVDGAADVARESADIVLLGPDLAVLRRGLDDGRRTFANTLKYIRITTSANFGNMISMALAAPVLPFLPLTAAQILLNNFLSDLPSMTLAADRVDAAEVERAPQWDVGGLRRFMIVFGLISSVVDLASFALLRLVFEADEATFRTAWFELSLMTELVVLLLLRTRAPAWRSAPSPLLLAAAAAVALAGLALPLVPPLAGALGFVPLAPGLWLAVALLLGLYAVSTEAAKHLYQARVVRHRAPGRARGRRALRRRKGPPTPSP